MFVCNQAEIPLKFTDKVPFLADLSVSKTHFTDKPAISSDLSVKISRNWLPLRIPTRMEAKVDKNRAKCLKFVYRLPKMVRASPKVDQK